MPASPKKEHEAGLHVEVKVKPLQAMWVCLERKHTGSHQILATLVEWPVHAVHDDRLNRLIHSVRCFGVAVCFCVFKGLPSGLQGLGTWRRL